jgi:hypothetical protein
LGTPLLQPTTGDTNDLVIAVTHRHGRDLREFGPTFLTWPANYGGQGLSPGSAHQPVCIDCLDLQNQHEVIIYDYR